MRTALVLSLAMFSALGCAPEPAPSEANAAAEELSASIGPAGGTLEGRAGSALAGVRLVIPPGALSAPTTVRIAPVLDETALPPLARRVGQQFRIEPVGTALAMPASLTLPADRGRVSDFEQGDGDVKVWARTDGAFALVEPSATAAGSVTVPIRQFNVAAAGVRATLATAYSCGSSCVRAAEAPPPSTPSRIIQTPCADPNGFCVDRLNFTSSLAAESGFLLESNVVYLPSTSDGRYRVRRIHLTPPSDAEVPATFTGTSAAIRSNPKPLRMAFVRRPNGVEEVWSSHGEQGTGIFRFNNQPSARIAPASGAEAGGVVRTSNNELAYFEDTRFVVTDSNGAGTRRSLPTGVSGSQFSVAAQAPDNGVWVAGTFNNASAVLGFRTSNPPTMLGPITGFPARTTREDSGPHGLVGIDVNPRDGRVLATGLVVVTETQPVRIIRRSSAWVGAPGGNVRAVLTEAGLNGVMGSAGGIEFGPAVWGSDNAVWIPNTRSPEIYVLDPNNPAAVSTVVLSDAAPGTDAFANRCPQFIRAMADRSVLVVTADGTMLRVRRTPAL